MVPNQKFIIISALGQRGSKDLAFDLRSLVKIFLGPAVSADEA